MQSSQIYLYTLNIIPFSSFLIHVPFFITFFEPQLGHMGFITDQIIFFISRSITGMLLSMKTGKEPMDKKSSRDVETLLNSI